MKQKVVTISAQISAELEKALNMVCDLEERSKSYFIKKALEKLILEKTKGANFSKKETNPSAKKNNK